jgi:hypothetical protein
MACESPYSVMLFVVKYFNLDYQKTFIDNNNEIGTLGNFYDINPAGIKGLPTVIDTFFGPLPAFCPCDERIDENVTPLYPNMTLWSRTTCCSPCAQDANPTKTNNYVAGSVINYYDAILQSNKYPPLSDNKRWQCATSSISVKQMTWTLEGPLKNRYPFCYRGICWKDGEIDHYTDVETSGDIGTLNRYYNYYIVGYYSFIYQSFYEDLCCVTGNELNEWYLYNFTPEEYSGWNFFGSTPQYAMAGFIVYFGYYGYWDYNYEYRNSFSGTGAFMGAMAAKGGTYRIKMTSYFAVNPNLYSGPPLPGSDKGPMEETGVRKIDTAGSFFYYTNSPVNGQPCNSLLGLSSYWDYSIGEGVVKGGLIKPDIFYSPAGGFKPINTDSFITTEELFFVSCIIVTRKDGTIQAHFGHHQVQGIHQSDLITDYVLILPLVIPEFTFLGIVYETKTIPFVIENNWYNTDEITAYMTLPNSGGCYRSILLSKIMQAACTNNEKISPTFRRRMLEKQVLSRIKKVHYKP